MSSMTRVRPSGDTSTESQVPSCTVYVAKRLGVRGRLSVFRRVVSAGRPNATARVSGRRASMNRPGLGVHRWCR